MYLRLGEDGEKVGEVRVNPVSYTYSGSKNWVKDKLENLEQTGINLEYGVKIENDNYSEYDEGTAIAAEDELEEEKLQFLREIILTYPDNITVAIENG